MKLAHQRTARWVYHYSTNDQRRQLIPTLREGTTARPASASRLVERMRERAWKEKRGQ